MPVHGPLPWLIHTAAGRAVRDVHGDGVEVPSDGRVPSLDRGEAAAHPATARRRIMDRVPGRDYKGRTAHEASPLALALGGALI